MSEPAVIASADIKEVAMDVSPQAGGGRSTRRRRGGKGTRRRAAEDNQVGGGTDVGVEKADAPQAAAVTPTPAPVGKELAAVAAPTTMQVGGATQKVVIAPPKKKPAKLMLVPKQKATCVAAVKKTFKAKRVRVVIDNTAKTQKRRRQVLGRIDGMTEAQLREAAVTAKLAKVETVKKVPLDLLRQMMRDYQTLRGNLL